MEILVFQVRSASTASVCVNKPSGVQRVHRAIGLHRRNRGIDR